MKITPELVGKKVSCEICGTFTPEAVIREHNGAYYVCQNTSDGCTPSDGDKLGYKYSFVCYPESMDNYVEKIKVLESEYITALDDSMIGKKVSCHINGYDISEALIVKEGDRFYLANNKTQGGAPNNLHGYSGGWCAFGGDRLEGNSISKVKLLDPIERDYGNAHMKVVTEPIGNPHPSPFRHDIIPPCEMPNPLEKYYGGIDLIDAFKETGVLVQKSEPLKEEFKTKLISTYKPLKINQNV